jgi:hypothetical protein
MAIRNGDSCDMGQTNSRPEIHNDHEISLARRDRQLARFSDFERALTAETEISSRGSPFSVFSCSAERKIRV